MNILSTAGISLSLLASATYQNNLNQGSNALEWLIDQTIITNGFLKGLMPENLLRFKSSIGNQRGMSCIETLHSSLH